MNHLWRLLTELAIPHVTLLDLDRERETGGWGRVKYVIDQLLKVGKPREKLLGSKQNDGSIGPLSEADFESMGDWSVGDTTAMECWLKYLEQENVFFSQPLDIDFAMLRAFPEAYHSAASGTGPRIPDARKQAVKRQERLAAARRAVLKNEEATGVTYTADEKEAFIWHQYLFLGRGKPSTHILALNEVDPADLWREAPASLRRLVTRVREMLRPQVKVETGTQGAR